jgi:hypothetical protein
MDSTGDCSVNLQVLGNGTSSGLSKILDLQTTANAPHRLLQLAGATRFFTVWVSKGYERKKTSGTGQNWY